MLHCFGAMCAKTMLNGCASLIFATSIGTRTIALVTPGQKFARDICRFRFRTPTSVICVRHLPSRTILSTD